MSKLLLRSVSKVNGSEELVYRVVSSAYITHLLLTESGNELTKTIKRSGPNIDPCGIPMLICLKSERVVTGNYVLIQLF